MIKGVFVFLLISLHTCIYTQNTYQKVYSTDSSEEGAYISISRNNSYYVGGRSNFYDPQWRDFFVMKFDSLGDTLWTKYLGEPYEDEWLTGIAATHDGGVVCITTVYDTLPFATEVIKFDSVGTLTWIRKFFPIYANYEIHESSDCGLVFSYTSLYGFGIIKLDSAGNTLWQFNNSLSSQYLTETIEFIETDDRNFVIAATSSSNDILVYKVDSTGTIIWQRLYDGSGINICSDLIQTRDSGFVVLISSIQAPNSRAILLKLDAVGDTVWCKSFSNTSVGNEFLTKGLMEDTLGNLTYSAITLIGPSINKIELTRIDPNGTWLWSRMITGSMNDWPNALDITNTGEIILTGSTASYGGGLTNVIISRFDSNGYSGCNEIPLSMYPLNIQWNYSTMPLIPGTDSLVTVQATNPIIRATQFQREINCASVSIHNIDLRASFFQLYPNPTEGIVTIVGQLSEAQDVNIEVFDVFGQMVYQETITSTTSIDSQIDLSLYLNGLYIVNVHAGESFIAEKIIVQR